MAFIDFASAASGAVAIAHAPQSRSNLLVEESAGEETSTGLSALEWLVVTMARKDRLSSLREPGRISVAMGVLFGTRPNPRLADPKLEALRRLAVFAWHHGFAVPVSAAKNFLAVGYTSDQYETMLASISAARLQIGQRR